MLDQNRPPAQSAGPGNAEPAGAERTSIATVITASTLADGRELIYFDDPGSTVRIAAGDRRELGPIPPPASMRHDPLSGEWITYATHRQTRTFFPPADQCPLCPSVDGRLTEIPAAGYDVVVFENRFPSFPAVADQAHPDRVDPQSPPIPRGGRCEVVSFTSEHTGSFAGLSPERARTVVDAWVSRTAALSATDGVEQVFVFENRGEQIGVTLSHPHGQIYAYPYVAPTLRRQLDLARSHRDATGRNLFSDILADELSKQSRIVTRTDCWTVFVPEAARWPVEVHAYPNRQVADLTELTDTERDDLARVYLDTLQRLEALFDEPLPYIAGWYQSPVREDRDLGYLHLQISSPQRSAGKLKYLAGSETAMGAFINDVLPEDTARRLRAVPTDLTGRR